MVAVLMMSAKLATLDLCKIKLHYIVSVVKWPRFGNCNTSVTKVIITSIL